MIAAEEIKVTRAEKSKLEKINLENIPFGRQFTDHMFIAEFTNGQWQSAEIKPYQPIAIDPSLAAIHYGQAIFEGIKAYKNQEGKAFIFRGSENYKRFNISAERMQMPAVPEEIFMEGMRQLVDLDKEWIPNLPDHALYIRPFMFSSDAAIGVRPSDNYTFMIILSPAGPYYPAPIRIYVEEHYVRAVAGGVGYAKAAGNYGAAMFPTAEANKKGYNQVLWTDANEHRFVQECGTMNVFFIIGNKAITPGLEQGTILAGVTRQSVITILNEMGLTVEERGLSIDEIVEAYQKGDLREVFGTGTAATISKIKELCYRDTTMLFDVENWEVCPAVKNRLDDIKYGHAEDIFNWMEPLQ